MHVFWLIGQILKSAPSLVTSLVDGLKRLYVTKVSAWVGCAADISAWFLHMHMCVITVVSHMYMYMCTSKPLNLALVGF